MSDETEVVMDVHEVATCFPEMSEAAYLALKANIEAHGQLVPIMIFQGKIIDGRHRYRACRELGILPLYQECDGVVPLKNLVFSLNGHRRHLTKSQHAVVAAKLATLGVGRPPEMPQICGITQSEAAEGMGISKRLIQNAAALHREAEPCLVEAVARGEVDLDPAMEVAGLEPGEQAELVSRGPKAVKLKAAEIRRQRKARKVDHRDAEVGAATAMVPSAAPTIGSSSAELRPEDYPVRAKLANPTLFDKSVRLWQVVQEFLVQNDVAPFAADDPLYIVARHDHEKDFLDSVRMAGSPENRPLCRDCKGSGKGRDRSEVCDRCRGSGFKSARIPLACDQPAEGPPDGSTIDVGDPETGAGAGEDRTGGRRRKPARNRA